MRSWLTLALGVIIGQWLAFGGAPSPVVLHRLGKDAWNRRDYVEAVRFWSRAAALQPDNAALQYLRANALARLGHRQSAAEGYQIALLLEPAPPLARELEQALEQLGAGDAAFPAMQTVVPLEAARGVWVMRASLNGAPPARFLVDTGASVTVISPALAAAVGVQATGEPPRLELETLSGRAEGPTINIRSFRLGGIELNDVAAVIYAPGFGVDGILGNTVLARFTVTIDADRQLLALRASRR
ncbi:MAG: aspartyl protease family protein [Candidatus Rokubacteria bacterium]|nr:aspartyl protease family protein [Candidatus Rokubacteria bacterium]